MKLFRQKPKSSLLKESKPNGEYFFSFCAEIHTVGHGLDRHLFKVGRGKKSCSPCGVKVDPSTWSHGWAHHWCLKVGQQYCLKCIERGLSQGILRERPSKFVIKYKYGYYDEGISTIKRKRKTIPE